MHTIQLNEDEIISLNKVFDSAKNARAIRASTLRAIEVFSSQVQQVTLAHKVKNLEEENEHLRRELESTQEAFEYSNPFIKAVHFSHSNEDDF